MGVVGSAREADADGAALPLALRRAVERPRVAEGLAEIFRRNRHEADTPWSGADAGLPAERLADEAVRRLLDPATAGVADVGGLRLYLTPASDLRPGPMAIHVAAWDEDAQVWRPVAELPVPDPAAGA